MGLPALRCRGGGRVELLRFGHSRPGAFRIVRVAAPFVAVPVLLGEDPLDVLLLCPFLAKEGTADAARHTADRRGDQRTRTTRRAARQAIAGAGQEADRDAAADPADVAADEVGLRRLCSCRVALRLQLHYLMPGGGEVVGQRGHRDHGAALREHAGTQATLGRCHRLAGDGRFADRRRWSRGVQAGGRTGQAGIRQFGGGGELGGVGAEGGGRLLRERDLVDLRPDIVGRHEHALGNRLDELRLHLRQHGIGAALGVEHFQLAHRLPAQSPDVGIVQNGGQFHLAEHALDVRVGGDHLDVAAQRAGEFMGRLAP